MLYHRDRAGYSWRKWPAYMVNHSDLRFVVQPHVGGMTQALTNFNAIYKPRSPAVWLGGGEVREVSSRDAAVRTLTPSWSKCDATLRFTSSTEKYNSRPNHLAAFTGRSKITRLQSSCCLPSPPPTKPCSHLQPVTMLSYIFVSL